MSQSIFYLILILYANTKYSTFNQIALTYWILTFRFRNFHMYHIKFFKFERHNNDNF